MVVPKDWSATQSREGLVVARPFTQAFGKVRGDGEIGGSGCSSDEAEGQHNPGGAKDPWGSGVLNDTKTDPTCSVSFRANGRYRSRSEHEHYGRIKLGREEGCV